MRLARVLATGSLAAAIVVLTASAALAHPYVTDGATVPARSLATMTLAMGHGCGDETSGGGDPTREIALQVPAEIGLIEPHDTDLYTAAVETGSDGRVETVVWTATGDGVAAPSVTMDVVMDGDEGDELWLKVFQGCDGFEYRWIGTPDEPATDPAVRVTLTAPDPDAPPPPPAEPDTPGTEDPQTPPSQPTEPDPDEHEPDTASPPPPADVTPPAADGGGWRPWGAAGLGAGALAVAAIVTFRRRRRTSTPDGRGD